MRMMKIKFIAAALCFAGTIAPALAAERVSCVSNGNCDSTQSVFDAPVIGYIEREISKRDAVNAAANFLKSQASSRAGDEYGRAAEAEVAKQAIIYDKLTQHIFDLFAEN